MSMRWCLWSQCMKIIMTTDMQRTITYLLAYIVSVRLWNFFNSAQWFKISYNLLVASKPPKFCDLRIFFLKFFLLIFFNSSKLVLTGNFFVYWPIRNSFSQQKVNCWYFVKKVFGDLRHFGGSGATNELIVSYLNHFIRQMILVLKSDITN